MGFRDRSASTDMLDPVSCDMLVSEVEGDVLFRETEGFEKARTAVWNLDTAGNPTVIVKCLNATDVAQTIKFARHNHLRVCVHTAGAHSSHAMVDNSAVVDMSLLRSVRVDPSACMATVGGGATIGDVDGACKPHCLVLPMGHVHHTGVAGMALNATSGYGYLSRSFRLTVSHLQSAVLVTSNGEVLNVSEDENSDLFWGIRGAGANFGVAIEMVFSLSRMPAKIFGGDLEFGNSSEPGPVAWREDAVLKFIDFFDSAAEECAGVVALIPKGPAIMRIIYVPKQQDGVFPPEAEMAKEAERAFKPLLTSKNLTSNDTGMVDFWDGIQKLGVFNPSFYYCKAALISDIPPAELKNVVQKLCTFAQTCPVTSHGTAILLNPLGGQLAKLDLESSPTAEVWSTRKWWAVIMIEYPEGSRDSELRERCIQWVRDVHAVVSPFSVKDEGRVEDYWTEFIGDIYGRNVPRLRELKSKYDPQNVFSLNRNILPK